MHVHRLQGPIPLSWTQNLYWKGELGLGLTYLSLAGSGLTSSIPSPWTLVALTYLDLSSNALSSSFNHILTSDLQYLDLSFNGLGGTWQLIDWSLAPKLRTLKLNSVSMVGTFPTGEVNHQKARARGILVCSNEHAE